MIKTGKLYKIKDYCVARRDRKDFDVGTFELTANTIVMVCNCIKKQLHRVNYDVPQLQVEVLSGMNVGWIVFDNPSVDLYEWVGNWLEELP